MMQHNFDPMSIFQDPEMVNHLAEKVERPMHELMELQDAMASIAGKAGRRMEVIKKHMMYCETCLNKQMANGTLIPLQDYWAAGPMMGAGRLPKLHRMVN